jgi:hypothetical protein
MRVVLDCNILVASLSLEITVKVYQCFSAKFTTGRDML